MSNFIHCVVCFVLFSSVVFGSGQTVEETDEAINEGLQCYACYGMGPNNDCELFEPYRKAKEEGETDGPVKLKTCSAPFNKSCMIETFRNNDGEFVHIRDCSDDKTFDFTEVMTNISSYQRLLELKDNNETACVYDSKNLVCLSKCAPQSVNDTANFCNGPQFDQAFANSFSAAVLTVSGILVFLMSIRV